MKKILLFLFATAISSIVFSQTHNFGLKGGLNIANIGGDARGVENKIGLHAGLFAIIKPNESFGVQPEIVFSRQGAKASSNNDVKFHYDYINIPVMFNYYPSEKFFLQAGPQLGVLIGAKATDGKDSEDLEDQLNSTDFSFGFGLGYDINTTVIGFRYNLGLSNTAKNAPDDEKYPNQVIQLSVGFKIN